jgi:FtsP/CotA-like multicopper oxidase with cupredoxin domain
MNNKFLGQGDFADTSYYLVPPGLQTGCKATKGSKESFKVDASQKWIALHFIGALSLKIGTVSIDEHPMWIYAVDGQYIRPQLAHTFSLRNGERYSAMIKLDKTPGDYTIRVANNLPNQLLSGYATLSYAHGLKMNGSIPYIDYGGSNVTDSVIRLDDKLLVPFNAPPVAKSADAMHILTLGRLGANWRWTLNDVSSYDVDLERHLPLLQHPNATSDMGSKLTIATKNNTWVDLIFVVAIAPSNQAQPEHAMHKHGNKMYLIGRGTGNFTWKSVDEAMKAQPESFNLTHAQYRDTVSTATTIKEPSWIAARYYSQNPGPFIVHCHMITHQVGGMAIVLMDGVDKWPKVPEKYVNGQFRLIS